MIYSGTHTDCTSSYQETRSQGATYGSPRTTLVSQPRVSTGTFVGRVYALLTVSLLISAAGSFYGVQSGVALEYFWPAVGCELGSLILLLALRRVPVLNLLLLMGYTFFSGFTIAPLLNYYLAAGLGAVIVEAAVITGSLFGVLSAYVHWTKRDFSWMERGLFGSLVVLIFMGFGLLVMGRPLDWVIWSTLGVVVFVGFVLYDTSNLYHRYAVRDAGEVVEATVDLYLDIMNLFLDMLRILSWFSDD